MELLDRYESLRLEILSYFGYVEQWSAIPIDDARKYFWKLDGEGPGTVMFAETENELETESGQYYENSIYTQRNLPKWVYRGAKYTMIVVDIYTDGNKFLQIFSNEKEIKN